MHLRKVDNGKWENEERERERERCVLWWCSGVGFENEVKERGFWGTV